MSNPMAWIAGPDTGVSSKAIWSHMMTGDVPRSPFGIGHPHDPDDFGRCYRLLTIVPEWRPRIGEMARYSTEWAALVAIWDELEAAFVARHLRPMYDTMRDTITAARVCLDCGAVGMSSWSTYAGGEKRCAKCAVAWQLVREVANG